MLDVDHLLWAHPDIDVGIERLRQLTGFDPVLGGQHVDWGTHNALVGLGDTYLEVLAIDPDQRGGRLADELVGLLEPRLHRWALRTTNMDGVVARVEVAGLHMRPVSMARTTPDGVELRWEIAFVEGHDYGPIVPFVIDWLDSPSPARTLPGQGRLVAVDVQHPDPLGLGGVLEAIGSPVEVVGGPAPTLLATLETPIGLVTLD